jgi:hypothetical protein
MHLRTILLTALFCLPLPASRAIAADGAWKFEIDGQDHPILTYTENGKTAFLVGCGRAFGLHIKYPGTAKKEGKASLVLANARTKMTINGEFQETDENDSTDFVQWDLGYKRQDPALFGKAWDKQKSKLLSFIASGPLTVSAEGKSYQLPPVGAAGWQARFEKRC